MADPQYALLLDGGFVKKRLSRKVERFPEVDDIPQFIQTISTHEALGEARLLRIYWYDADPFSEKRKNPLDGKRTNYSGTKEAIRNKKLIVDLEQLDDFAVRRGELLFRGWRVKGDSITDLATTPPRNIRGSDLEPVFIQKGVDMRIGLDVAALALKKLASTIVLVTGDSDMVPAMKLARREGMRVFLHTMGSASVRKDLTAHSDRVLG